MLSFRRNTSDHRSWLHVSDNTGTSSDHSPIANDERLVRQTIYDYRSSAEKNLCADVDVSGNMTSGRKSRIIADSDIMAYKASEIYMHVPADLDIGCQNRSCANNTPFANCNELV